MALGVYADLWLANRWVNPVVNPQVLTGRVANINPPPALGQGRVMVSSGAHQNLDATLFKTPEEAVLIPRQALLLNLNLIESVPKLDGFFSLYLPRAGEVVARLALLPREAAPGLLDFLGVSHVSDPSSPWRWTRREGALPPLTMVPEVAWADGTNALEQLFSPQFNPRRQVLLPAAAAAAATPAAVPGEGSGRREILAAHYAAGTLKAVVTADRPTWLVIAQADYPGWQATLDGASAQLWRANYAFQALAVPPGLHHVEIRFRPRSVLAGAVLSAVSVAVCLWSMRSRSHETPGRD
jgi:hypothetical protein